MSAPVFPETPIADDDAYLADIERRVLKSKHWRRGWLSGFQYENGVPVRMWFAECIADCPCHDDAWWEQ